MITVIMFNGDDFINKHHLELSSINNYVQVRYTNLFNARCCGEIIVPLI